MSQERGDSLGLSGGEIANARPDGEAIGRLPGSYLLLLELARPQRIAVGRLGTFDFPSGWYVYAGSALAGVRQRVARHARASRVRHWHVDYLLAAAHLREAYIVPESIRLECELARGLLAMPGAAVPAPRFGASDCRCSTHLVHFISRPGLDSLGMRDMMVLPVGGATSSSPFSNGELPASLA